MKLCISVAAAALVVATGSVASAQFRITPGGLSAGNGFFRNGTIPTSLTGTGSANSEFRPTTATSADQSFQSAWWFRPQGATREFVFGNGSANGYTSAGVIVGNDLGTLDIGGYDFTVTGNGVNFRSEIRYQIFAGAAGPTVTNTNTIVNLAQEPLVIDLFSYEDFDANATASADIYSYSDKFNITDGPISISWRGFGASAYQATQWSALRGLLANAAVDNLNNTVAGSPGDFTGAFQWTLTVGVGQSLAVSNAFAIPAPGSVAMLGLGGLLAARRRR